MTKYITVKLTEDQSRTLIDLVGEEVIFRREYKHTTSSAYMERIHQTLIRAKNRAEGIKN